MKAIAIILAAIVVSLVPAIATAQTTGFTQEQIVFYQSSKAVQQLDIYIAHSFTNNIGMFGCITVGKDYSQAYVGPTFSFVPWLQLGIGTGPTQGFDQLLVGSFGLVTYDRYSILFIEEYSGAGNFYRTDLNVTLTKWLGVGLQDWKGAGFGPRLEINLPKTPIKLWGAPLYDNEGKTWNGVANFQVYF